MLLNMKKTVKDAFQSYENQQSETCRESVCMRGMARESVRERVREIDRGSDIERDR